MSELFRFITISFRGFFCFLKPILSFRTIHSIFMPFAITYLTISSALTAVFWKLMPLATKHFSSIYGTGTRSFKNVFFLSNKSKVCRVATRGVFAKVVYHTKSFIVCTSWNWFNKYRVHDSMYSFSNFIKIYATVPSLVFAASPIPTTRHGVNRDVFKYPFVFPIGHLIVYKFHNIIIP